MEVCGSSGVSSMEAKKMSESVAWKFFVEVGGSWWKLVKANQLSWKWYVRTCNSSPYIFLSSSLPVGSTRTNMMLAPIQRESLDHTLRASHDAGREENGRTERLLCCGSPVQTVGCSLSLFFFPSLLACHFFSPRCWLLVPRGGQTQYLLPYARKSLDHPLLTSHDAERASFSHFLLVESVRLSSTSMYRLIDLFCFPPFLHQDVRVVHENCNAPAVPWRAMDWLYCGQSVKGLVKWLGVLSSCSGFFPCVCISGITFISTFYRTIPLAYGIRATNSYRYILSHTLAKFLAFQCHPPPSSPNPTAKFSGSRAAFSLQHHLSITPTWMTNPSPFTFSPLSHRPHITSINSLWTIIIYCHPTIADVSNKTFTQLPRLHDFRSRKIKYQPFSPMRS